METPDPDLDPGITLYKAGRWTWAGFWLLVFVGVAILLVAILNQ